MSNHHPVRNYFIYRESIDKSECKHCNVQMSGKHAQNLLRHLKRKHTDVYEKMQEPKKVKSDSSSAQEKLEKYFKVSSHMISVTKDQLFDGCVELVTKNGRPLALIEDSGFRKIIEPLCQSLGICINKSYIRQKVIEKAVNLRDNLRSSLRNRLFSLKLDCVTRLDRSIMGINAQYCENGVIIIQTLAMKEVHVKHTSLNLTHMLMEVLESYGVSLAQICSITIDNAANMVSLGNFVNKELQNIDNVNSDKNDHNMIDLEFDEDDESDGENKNVAALDASYCEIYSNLEVDLAASDNIIVIRCASHTLNLAVCDFLKEIKDIRSKVKTVVKKLRTPTLLHLLRAEKLRKPVNECVTRWGSTYNMFLSLLQLKSFCEKSAADIADLLISETDWLTIKSVCSVLEPVYVTSVKLQKKELLLSDLYFAWYSCKRKIDKIWGKYGAIFSQSLKKRGENLLRNPYVLAAVYLDPRYQIFLTDSQKTVAIEQIINVFNLKSKLIGIQASEDSSISSKISTDDEIDEILKEMGKNETKFKNRSLIDKIKSFDNTKRLSNNIDVLKFWHNYPDEVLSKLAQIILGVPATQVSVERAFSTLKFILGDLRGNINEDLLEDILLINLN